MDNTTTSSKKSLKGFWSLFLTQFQGAFSDNLFKFLAIYFVMKTYEGDTNQIDSLIPLIGAV